MEENKQIVEEFWNKEDENHYSIAGAISGGDMNDLEFAKKIINPILLQALTTKDLAWQKKIEEAIGQKNSRFNPPKATEESLWKNMGDAFTKGVNEERRRIRSLLLPPITTK